MNEIRFFVITVVATLLAGVTFSVSAQGITHFEEIAPDLYFVGNVSHNTVFLVTETGIILADPTNRDFSMELKAEIEERFDVPVRYVLYSHHHGDHVSGGAVWEDTALFIGHENMLSHFELPPADTPLPPEVAEWDADGNGRIAKAEAPDWTGFNTVSRGPYVIEGFIERIFDFYDVDGDGSLTGAEVERGALNEVRVPDITYRDRITVTLGGKTAEMVFTGVQTHSDDLSVIVFPEQSVAYMADFISIIRLPRYIRGNDEPIESWLDGIRVVEAQNFTIAAPGHGVVGGSEYVTFSREYLTKLRDEVAAGIAAGETVEELQERIYMEEYSDWISYDEFRAGNIEDMYNLLTRD